MCRRAGRSVSCRKTHSPARESRARPIGPTTGHAVGLSIASTLVSFRVAAHTSVGGVRSECRLVLDSLCESTIAMSLSPLAFQHTPRLSRALPGGLDARSDIQRNEPAGPFALVRWTRRAGNLTLDRPGGLLLPLAVDDHAARGSRGVQCAAMLDLDLDGGPPREDVGEGR